MKGIARITKIESIRFHLRIGMCSLHAMQASLEPLALP